MHIKTDFIEISTKGNSDIINVTPQVDTVLKQSGIREGQLTVFASGATAGVTTIEFEPGLLRDLPEALEKIAPASARYHHNDTWHDGNGHGHVRASMIGPSLTVPFQNGQMILGTWQQIVIIDCDTRSRHRKITVQMIGE